MGGSDHGAPDRRAPKEEGRRFAANWDLTAGYRDDETVRGRVYNISASGLLIRVPVPYVIGSLAEIEMSPAVGVFIRAIVQVIREHASGRDWFEYGVQIISQKEEDRSRLQDALLSLRRAEIEADFGRSQPIRRT
jgi:hypothetical protein